MIKKLMITIGILFMGNVIALPTHVLNTAFLLITDPHIKEQEKAKQILSAFFLEDNGEMDFLIEQPSKMSNCLNEAAFQTVGGNRELAISTIKNYFSCEKLEVTEFAIAFVDWGIELLKMNTIFNPENKKT